MENEQVIVRDFRNARFFWLDNEVVDIFLLQIGSTAFAVYSYMCRFVSNETQTCWPSMALMAERLQLSKSTIHRSLKILEEFKMLRVIEKGKQHNSSEYQMLDVCTQRSTDGTLNVPSVPSSVPKQAIQSSATVPEQDLYNKTYKQDLILSPPSSELKNGNSKKANGKTTDSRHAPFRLELEKFWKWMNPSLGNYYWSAGDAGQLSRFIRQWPSLDLPELRCWLKNYSDSDGIIETKAPREFLPRLHQFANSPLNSYGKPREEKHAVL